MTHPRMTTGLTLFALLATSASAGIRRHDRDDALYQDLGNQIQFASVARLALQGPNGPRTCSGTLINSEWILTAAHCFDGVDGGFNAAIFDNGGFSLIEEVVVHPGWSEGGFTAGGDLALVRLASPITNVATAQLYTGSNELGMIGTGVGYGASGTGNTGDIPNTMGTKRAGTNMIDVLGSVRGFNESILMTDFDNPNTANDSLWGSSDPTDLEYQVAPGDSGGALFMEENGVLYLAGVTSFINAIDGNPDGDYGDMSAYTRVSDYNAWINSVIPAPSGLLVLSSGMLMVSRRRRD